MNEPYTVTLDGFEGPLGTLLGLIEERKLEIERVSLSAVTEDFFKHLEGLMHSAGEEAGALLYTIADFLVVASRLVLIKSKWLVPELRLTEEEEAEIRDLEARLALYRRIKPIMRGFRRAWQARVPLFSREYFLSYRAYRTGSLTFYPDPRITNGLLQENVRRLLEAAAAQHQEVQEVRERILSLDTAITEVAERVTRAASTSFSNITASRTKGDIVILFLALLHLARDQAFALVQEDTFSDIVVHKPVAPHNASHEHHA